MRVTAAVLTAAIVATCVFVDFVGYLDSEPVSVWMIASPYLAGITILVIFRWAEA